MEGWPSKQQGAIKTAERAAPEPAQPGIVVGADEFGRTQPRLSEAPPYGIVAEAEDNPINPNYAVRVFLPFPLER